MNKQEIIQNWIYLSDYDIATAKVMLETKRYLYVAFMCQQAIEKLLKACFVKEKEQTPPFRHSLIRLSEKLSVFEYIEFNYQNDLELLNSYYIESRYSEDYQEISKTISPKKAKKMFDFTEEFLQWLKSQML